MRRFFLSASAVVVALGLGVWPGVATAGRSEAHLASITIAGCDTLQFGYTINGGKQHMLAKKSNGCGPAVSVMNKTIRYPAGAKLLLFLEDASCSEATYFSDGSGTADHAAIYMSGGNTSSSFPYQVDIADAGVCNNTSVPETPAQGKGNLDLISDTNVG